MNQPLDEVMQEQEAESKAEIQQIPVTQAKNSSTEVKTLEGEVEESK